MTEALCWAHARRNFFQLAELAEIPPAIEAAHRCDLRRRARDQWSAGRTAPAVRQAEIVALVGEFEIWMRGVRGKMSRHTDVAKSIDYMLKRWPSFTPFLDDGRPRLTDNAAERALRGIGLGRKAWSFGTSDRGGERAAFIFSLIFTAKMNDVDPRVRLADVLARIGDHPPSRLDELRPWNWHKLSVPTAIVA